MKGSFEHFFEKVNEGFTPFLWQSRLAEWVATNGWPEEVHAPTAAGKTALLEIAVFTLAQQAGRSALDRTAPLRTFFVIDRRVVVDQAYKRARSLAAALLNPTDDVVAEVAAELRKFGGEVPLLAVELRGGIPREHRWMDAPNQPLLCVTTVDQIGSRMLFRGYGVSRRQRPVDAGMTALDSLVVLDEAHLSLPFAETVSGVRRWMDHEAKAIASPVRLVQMSATLDGCGGFELKPEERKEGLLARRFDAAKLATFEETAHFEKDAASLALEMLNRVQTVAVVVNRVASARAIFERVKQKIGEDEVVLLTGRVREWDRARLMERFLGRLSPRRKRNSGERRLCVVATQTIEVGADLDFDGLITEAASLDAMRQRLGRLDRLGKLGKTEVVVLRRKPANSEERTDPVYGKSLERTWKWLAGRVQKGKPVDCGTNALDLLLKLHPPKESLYPEPEHAPVLLPSHLDALVQTNPEPAPDPAVGVFLHGAAALNAADVNVVWRADLTGENREHWPTIVSLAPPVMGEALPVPVYAVRRWLERRETELIADLEGVSVVEEAHESNQEPRPALIWSGPDETKFVGTVQDVYPGCTLLVPASEGGSDEHGWCGAAAENRPVRDIGDFCYNEGGKHRLRPRLRLHPEVLKSWDPDADGSAARSCTALSEYVARRRAELEGETDLEDLLEMLRPFAPAGSGVARALDAILVAAERDIELYPDGSGVVLTAIAFDEQDEDLDFTVEVKLADHAGHVKDLTCAFTGAIGLRPELRNDLELAAELHDLGKSEPRFQAMLYCGRQRCAGEPLLAKSDARSFAAIRRAARLAQWPEGARHEFISVALLAGAQGTQARAVDWELVQHLVGAHHGFGRALPPFLYDPCCQNVSTPFDGELLSAASDHGLYRLDSGWVDRFWELVERYGYWGLAFLEAVLRRADCVASRKEGEGAYRCAKSCVRA